MARALFLLGLVSFWTNVASAQDAAQARALFEQGLAAARAEHWEDARAAFQQSLAISERPSTLLNLAGADVETGHLVEGAASYRRFLELAPPRDAHRAEAQRALATVVARIAEVTIQVDGRRPGDEVRLDDAVLLPAVLGAPMAIDPGTHTVRVVRAGREIGTQTFDAPEGGHPEVSVSAVVVETPVVVASDVIEEPVEETPAASGGDDTVWIVLGVCLGVAVVAGVAVGIGVATQPGAPTPYQGNFGMGVLHFN